MRFLFFPILMTLAVSVSAQQQSGFVIEGYIAGLGNGKVLLGNKPESYESGFRQIYYDSTFANNGHFTFRGSLKEPQFLSLQTTAHYGWLPILMSNSHVTVKGEVTAIWRAAVTGSPEDSLRSAFSILTRVLVDSMNNASVNAVAAADRGDSAACKIFRQLNRQLYRQMGEAALGLVKTHPDRYFSLLQIESIREKLGKDAARQAYTLLSTEVRQYALAQNIKAALE